MAENDLKGPERVPEGLEELGELIAASERKGIDVGEAWRLYNEAEADAEKAPLLIERATVYLYRMKRLRTVSAVALLATAVVAIGALSHRVADYVVGLFGYEIVRHEYVVGVPLAAVAVALGLAWRFWGGFFKVRAGVPSLPEKAPADTEGLRSLITEHERACLNVNEAWRLYGRAVEREADEGESRRRKARFFIELAYAELSRLGHLRRISREILAYGVAALFSVAAFGLVTLGFSRTTSTYKVALIVGGVVFVMFAGRFLQLCWRGYRVKRRGPALQADDVPRDTRRLREVIILCQTQGIGVDEDWALYEEAKKFENEGDSERAAEAITKAYGSLVRKENLLNTSKDAFVVCVIILPIVILLFVALCYWHARIEGVTILTVPAFIIAWGFIGSISYVLLSVYTKIQEKAFEWYDLPGYLYRIVLGGVLAGVTFYVIQLGVTSLPGAAGEEVNIAVAGGPTAAEFRKHYFEQETTEKEKLGYERLKIELNNFAISTIIAEPKNATEVLLNDKVWEKYGAKNADGRMITAGVLGEELVAYEEKNRIFAATRNKLKDAVSEAAKYITERDKKETTKLGKVWGDEPDASYKAISIITWANGHVTELKSDAELEEKIKRIKDVHGNYDEVRKERDAAKKRLAEDVLSVKAEAALGLDGDIEKAEKKLAELEPESREWGHLYRSVELRGTLEELRHDIIDVEEKIIKLKKAISGLELSGSPTGGGVERLKEQLKDKEAELALKESEMMAVSKELKAALARDFGKPMWEAPVFIVIAFLSGYSVEFVTRLLKRAQEAALPEKAKESKEEEERKRKREEELKRREEELKRREEELKKREEELKKKEPEEKGKPESAVG